MGKRHKPQQKSASLIELPFKSILDSQPKDGQFVLVAWFMRGYSGYSSLAWDTDNPLCQNTVAWFTIPLTHVFTKKCGIALRRNKNKLPTLDWHEHYSVVEGETYISKVNIPKVAVSI